MAAMFAAAFLMSSPALAAPGNGPSKLGLRTLQLGMTGPDVTTLQKDLTVSGIPTFASGVYSVGTMLHVKQFQKRYRLTADGVVGPETATKINSVVAVLNKKEAADEVNGAVGLAGPGGAGIGAPGSSGAPGAPTGTTATAPAPTTPLPAADTGGAAAVPPPSNAPVESGSLNSQGLAVPPPTAPLVISEVIAAANQIAFDPYIYGGGHASFDSVGYDCSGSVSFALHGGGLLSTPVDSTQFESYGVPGPGRWITLWANGGHVYMEIAGLFYDTAAQSATNGNDRWSTTRISPTGGFIEVHPAGW